MAKPQRPGKGESVLCLPRDYTVVDTETTGLSTESCCLIEYFLSGSCFDLHSNKISHVGSFAPYISESAPETADFAPNNA